jgi:hypothetical protein
MDGRVPDYRGILGRLRLLDIRTSQNTRRFVHQPERLVGTQADIWKAARVTHDRLDEFTPRFTIGSVVLDSIEQEQQRGPLVRPVFDRNRGIAKDVGDDKRDCAVLRNGHRPESEWRTEQRDHYRIVSDELWQAVRQRMGADRLNAGTSGAGRPVRTLFGGLLRCPLCDGAMVAVSARAYGCVTRKERGAEVCKGVHLLRAQTDERLLGVLRDELARTARLPILRTQFGGTLPASFPWPRNQRSR